MNYSRISGAVSIDLLENTHIVGIGAGGAYCLYEALVRSGVGKLTVFDIDTVDDVNFCRQGFYPHQVGMYKVDALEQHLLSINPNLDFTKVVKNFLDMDEQELDLFFGDADLFLFLTDSFKAQSFGNKLALKYQTPAIWGGFYEKSQCAEIIFWIPNVTPACFRCITQSRYEAQEANGSEIKVSSNCNTMFHSQMLDSMLGMLIMAILHNTEEGYEFSEYFDDYWDRNLIQFKVSPDYKSRLFDNMYIQSEGRAVLFNAVWQQIENCECPDCM